MQIKTLAIALFAAAAAHAQSAPPDRVAPPPAPPAGAPAIVRHVVYGTVDPSGVARVEVDLLIRNPGPREEEFELVFPADEGAALESFELFGPDRKPLAAHVYPAAEARSKYEEIVRRRRDPALLEFAHRALFYARIFPIPARGETPVRLTYSQALEPSGDLLRLCYPLPAGEIRFEIFGRPATVYSPTHAFEAENDRPDVTVLRWRRLEGGPEAPRAMALFLAPPSGTPLDARAIAYRAPGSEEGYFLLILSPNVGEEKEEIGKNIVIVLDRSGSMAGRKIEQARGALRYVLSSLGPKDLFNVVAFNDNLRPFQPSLVKYNKDARDEALRFAESVTAEGGTNIHDAIRLALSQMPENGRPNVVIFLTDGIPTIGAVRETGAILKAVKAANERGARLFVFGVGHDVDAKFLDRLALQNRGIADYVAPEEDIETKVTSFYATIRHPVLTDLKLSIAGSAGSGKLDTYDLYPRELPDLFRGRPLVLAGRYRTLGGRACAAEVALEGKVGPEARRFVYPLRFESTPSNAFVGRLWATRRVGYLVDEIRLNGASEEVVREIVRLGTEFGIITEYTSFLIDEDRAFGVNAANVARAQEEVQRRAAASTGSYGFSQAANSKTWQRADQLGKENCWRDEKGREVRAEAIRNVGSKTFYWRGNRWIDGACQDERAVEGAVVVRLFSEEYFALARRAAEAGQWLSVGNEVTLVLEGKIYRVVENAEAR